MTREPRILKYTRWLAAHRGLHFDPTTTSGYDALWRWSTTELEAFWQTLWEFFAIESATPWTRVLDERRMPGAKWFDGATLNYAQQVFRHADAAHAAGHPAILFMDEERLARGEVLRIDWPELRRRVGALAAELQRLGIRPGDRVCAFLPNTPDTAAAFLAAASVGAVWSVCSPDMGPLAVLDRFAQIEPRLLFAVGATTWGGVQQDRRDVVAQIVAGLPALEHVVQVGGGDAVPSGRVPRLDFDALLRGDAGHADPQPLPFDHPLWIVYSSGTTGLPKAIVHGHGGIVVEALKGGLHNDLGPTVETGDRFFWFSTTGWIMWNAQIAALLSGTTACIFDGNPGGGAKAPDWTTLWRFAAATGVTFFGAGAAFYASCMKAGIAPTAAADLAALRAVGSTGSPLSEDGYRWIRANLPRPDGRPIWIDVISGGTDFAGAFVAGLRTLPEVDGEMQCRSLGAAVEAWNEAGQPLADEVGELVCTLPIPSMPLYFWNDPQGRRYHDSYFDTYPGGNGKPAVWRHGDWIRITPRGGAIIYGRSDATINRHGIRMGTAELYRAVEALPEVLDSLVVDLEYLGRESWMPLFVVLREGVMLDDTLTARIKATVRTALSPRHVPNDVFQVSSVPRTLSGKKMELPVKKLLMGASADTVFKRDAMANADSVEWFAALAARRASG